MWQDIIGHSGQIALLKEFVTSQKVPHALLLSGPAGVGKTLVAREFFKALNCLESPGNPCDHCRNCLKAAGNQHPDLSVVELARSGPQVELIRDLLQDLALKPFEARWKMIVLEPAEYLNQSSANALLKSLEEPPAATVFILVSHRRALLLPTIVSRCQIIRFAPVAAGTAPYDGRDPYLLRLTAGTLGGLPQAGEADILPLRNQVIRILQGEAAGAISATAAAADDLRDSMPLWLSVVESVLRDIMTLRLGGDDLINAELRDLPVGAIRPDEMERIFETLRDLRRGQDDNLNNKVALAALLIQLQRLCGGATGAP